MVEAATTYIHKRTGTSYVVLYGTPDNVKAKMEKGEWTPCVVYFDLHRNATFVRDEKTFLENFEKAA